MRGEPHVDALVGRADAPRVLDHPCDEEAGADRSGRDHEEPGEHRDREDDCGICAEQPYGKPVGRAAGPRTEHADTALLIRAPPDGV